ncbi:MAG: dihydrofolate reductase [Gammaproteobacteria bacterium]|jgi:dihydrofolate reductase|tara:strand:- start:1721 stop:2203 length:483 start_codon:yes stop_codon:yes gene_type:complete
MNLSIIVAMSKNRVIGKDNKMPWHLSNDLKNFKKITIGKTIVMGRLTYDSIGRPLPERKNIVLSRNLIDSDVFIFDNFEEVLNFTKDEDEVFIIGGQDIYSQTIDKVNKLYLTTIDANIEGDKYFPEIDISKWKKIRSENFSKDQNNTHDFVSELYIKNI